MPVFGIRKSDAANEAAGLPHLKCYCAPRAYGRKLSGADKRRRVVGTLVAFRHPDDAFVLADEIEAKTRHCCRIYRTFLFRGHSGGDTWVDPLKGKDAPPPLQRPFPWEEAAAVFSPLIAEPD